ncbi:MAG: DUF507 family protein [Nitrospiraceae bacterium]
MKLTKERVRHMAESFSSRLQEQEYLEMVGSPTALVEELDRAITEELTVEDRLNAEVRELMKTYEDEIERGRLDYQKMFTMIKNKLAKERGLIL